MSDHIDWIADVDATPEEAPLLAERGLAWLVDESIVQPLATPKRSRHGSSVYRPGPKASAWSVQVDDHRIDCGVEITIGRTVFYSCPGPISVRCRHCGTSHDEGVPWGNAVTAWFDNEGDDSLACPVCSRSERIVDWTFLEFDWAFGYLGFGFHNWSIDRALAEELGRVLGHRVKLAHQHF